MGKNSLKNIKKSGFKIPKDYFESFEDLLYTELKLKETASDTGFNVPKDYFENLDNEILAKIKTLQEPKIINLISWRKVAYVTSIAASLVIMFNVLFTKNSDLNIEGIETATIENYILTEGLESTDFASLFNDEDLSEITSIKNNLSSETLENYVLDNLEIEELITNNN